MGFSRNTKTLKMQSFYRILIQRQTRPNYFSAINRINNTDPLKTATSAVSDSPVRVFSTCNPPRLFHQLLSPTTREFGSRRDTLKYSNVNSGHVMLNFSSSVTTIGSTTSETNDILTPPRIKFKRLDKTAKHIMQILDNEAVQEVRARREIPDVQPGCIMQLKVEVPENKRRVSVLKGIVIARRNAGLNTTFRLRRQVAGVGVESLFPLYSPNIKEIKILERKKVRRAKLYYLRDKMNALKK